MPSALDNRPLTFEEFEHRMNQVIYVSATPAPYELKKTDGVVAEQVIRPTGLVDPEVEVLPVNGQVDDLLEQIRQRTARNERILVTTLTKRMAEDLAEYLAETASLATYIPKSIPSSAYASCATCAAASSTSSSASTCSAKGSTFPKCR